MEKRTKQISWCHSSSSYYLVSAFLVNIMYRYSWWNISFNAFKDVPSPQTINAGTDPWSLKLVSAA
uniref:Uncharacterized protein n=1 Tax=Rhizophora mucronata TaxID=61149 RepID=A0A2P2PKJ4_RHIMU